MTESEIIANWENCRILDGIKDESRKFAVMTCLEVQRKINKLYDCNSRWQRCSISIIRRVFAETKNLFINENFMDVCEFKTDYRLLKTKFEVPQLMSWQVEFCLDTEAEMILNFSEKAVEELNEMFKDTQGKIKFGGLRFTDDGIILYS
jgi:hypothetical protein